MRLKNGDNEFEKEKEDIPNSVGLFLFLSAFLFIGVFHPLLEEEILCN